MSRERKIIVLNMFREGPVQEQKTEFGGVNFTISEHGIGWNFKLAAELIRTFDDFVDGFAVIGVQKKAAIGKTTIMHPGYIALLRAAVKSQIYLADDIRDFFSEWTLQRILKEQPQIFKGKRALFHCAFASPFLKTIQNAGAKIQAADSLLLLGAPVRLNGAAQIENHLKALKPFIQTLSLKKLNPGQTSLRPRVQKKLAEWIDECEIFASYSNLLEKMPSLEPLRGKILVTDYLTPVMRQKAEEAGLLQIIEFIPDHPILNSIQSRHFSVLTALVDQRRVAEDNGKSFEEYILQWVQESKIKPNRLPTSKGIVRRCAFIIHPLSQKLLWNARGLKKLEKAPPSARAFIEKMSARVPIFYYGSVTGATSQSTGQEVICDLFAMAATPKQLLSMNEEFVYKRLVEGSRMAQARGAALIGLGAYTKVVGDAGVTVARRSPIPVTNGNSYSCSTTLWAAKEMMEKMGMVPAERTGNRFRAKAMIIGATGSIGRISSLLVSLVCQEIVLIATRPDKLLELRDEILQLSPDVKVTVATHADNDLHDTDLIVTATSNQSGSILNIDRVRPGAVICDCSRPLDITVEEAKRRPDVLVIESGEVLLPGPIEIHGDIGLPKPAVYACLAETVLLTMEGRYENFSLSKQLSMERVKEIYRIGIKHGAKLSAIRGPFGIVTDESIAACRKAAMARLADWKSVPTAPGLVTIPTTQEVSEHGEQLF